MNKDVIIKNKLEELKKSKFRSSFRLKEKDLIYIKEKGWEVIKNHAYEIITKRLASKNIINDGKQTPIKGHPVFIAMHATACCCRKCLDKWHHIKPNKDLTKNEINYIVYLIMSWLKEKMR